MTCLAIALAVLGVAAMRQAHRQSREHAEEERGPFGYDVSLEGVGAHDGCTTATEAQAPVDDRV